MSWFSDLMDDVLEWAFDDSSVEEKMDEAYDEGFDDGYRDAQEHRESWDVDYHG
jgi:hypothetical protein